jgi:hypothetical protein
MASFFGGIVLFVYITLWWHLMKPVLFGPQVGESQPPDGARPEDQV